MTTDELLAAVRRLGMEVIAKECGGLALRGGGKVSPKTREAVVAALKLPVHRDELAARLGVPPAKQVAQPATTTTVTIERCPTLTRRIVLAEDGAETVLREVAAGEEWAALAEERARRRGAVLLLQHWAVTDTWGRWETFATTGPES